MVVEDQKVDCQGVFTRGMMKEFVDIGGADAIYFEP
jgi:hypothetical protein